MIGKKQFYRTDLVYEEFDKEVSTDTYRYSKKHFGDIKCNHVKIENEKNEFNRVVGDYIGVEFCNIDTEESRNELVNVCVDQFKLFLKTKYKRFLIVGLGNEEVIADALGNKVCKQLYVNAHLNKDRQVAVITPGVMGQTGLDTVSFIKSIVTMYNPDVVIAIDALATKDIKRLNRVIQITNTGIQPGSGIGNFQKSLDKQTLGIDVIAIGVSTVIDIVSIVNQVVSEMTDEMYKLIHDEFPLMVTPKEMDYELSFLANILARVINTALFTNVCVD